MREREREERGREGGGENTKKKMKECGLLGGRKICAQRIGAICIRTKVNLVPSHPHKEAGHRPPIVSAFTPGSASMFILCVHRCVKHLQILMISDNYEMYRELILGLRNTSVRVQCTRKSVLGSFFRGEASSDDTCCS